MAGTADGNGTLETFRGVVYPWVCDFMGHMNTQFYCTLFDGATLHFLNGIAKRAELQEANCGWVDVKQTIEYRHETRSGELLVITTRLLKVGTSSLTFKHDMHDADHVALRATSEHVVAMFNLEKRQSTPLLPAARRRAEQVLSHDTDTH